MKNDSNFASELQNVQLKYSKSLRGQMRKMKMGIFPMDYLELWDKNISSFG